MSHPRHQLETLARLYGIEISYFDISGQEHVASDQALKRMLKTLGALSAEPSEAEVDEALRNRENYLAQRVLEPVNVLWQGTQQALTLRIPEGQRGENYRLQLTLENGDQVTQEGNFSQLSVLDNRTLHGDNYVDVELLFSSQVDLGYHQVKLTFAQQNYQALVICTPEKAYQPENQDKLWGLFAPAYSLHQQNSSGAGTLAELRDLVSLTKENGGHIVGTLPLMATFLGEAPFEPSPYVPVSKRYWNEVFLDFESLPEFAACSNAKNYVESANYRTKAQELKALPHVDYHQQYLLRRPALEQLAQWAFEDQGSIGTELRNYLKAHPDLVDYAQFRAVTEAQKTSFHAWPEALKAGKFTAEDYQEIDFRYHAYCQFRMQTQLGELGKLAKAQGGGLYLDLPLGVHPDGYDAFKETEVFLDGLSAGAPPDALATEGQDWGFRPLNPEAMRAEGYKYFIECIQHQAQHAGVLRIDHVMGLHRIYCVPWDAGAKHGIYVKYRAEELWAILILESHRNQVMLVGEDLGTVPVEVRQAMDRHWVQRMYVMQFELRHDRHHAVLDVPENAVASINTHDTPSFAGFWQNQDIDDRQALGHYSEEHANYERGSRHHLREAVQGFFYDRGYMHGEPNTEKVLRAGLTHLAYSPARLVLLNLEDLWLERQPQNVPGTHHERPNWRRKAGPSLEEIRRMPQVSELLQHFCQLRCGRPAPVQAQNAAEA